MLHVLAWISILFAVACALAIVADEIKRPQKMAVMNVVWPVSALYFSVFAVWAYRSFGRAQPRSEQMEKDGGMQGMKGASGEEQKHPGPSPRQVATRTSHCGAGCMIADVVVEFWITAAGITLLGSVLWAEFAMDFAAAWLLGIVFQYFAIRPMRKDLGRGAAILSAIKADTLSIFAFKWGCTHGWRWPIFCCSLPRT